MTIPVGSAKTHALDAAVSGIDVVSLEAGGAPRTCHHGCRTIHVLPHQQSAGF